MTRTRPGPLRRQQAGALTLRRLVALLAAVAAVAALAAVFAAYFNPHLMVELANAVWACF